MGVKSEISRVRVRVTFFNASSRHVDIFWVDFNGKIVRYFHRAPPQSLKKILTYVTHPWVALDSDTGQKLCLSGEEVYVTKLPPRENVEEDEETEDDMPTVNIRIHIPVYTLESICIDFFRRRLKRSDMSELEVNQYVMGKLCFISPCPCKVYHPPRHI